ncbi:MAG: DNA-binding response regulator [Bacteroidetes bacterium]|nr:MAG: DNA-binding response regulator [Bacteroidota bacterium]
MATAIKILVVEDEMIIAAKIAMQLTNLGYEVTGMLARGEEAVLHVQTVRPDVVLLDIQLKGAIDGVETAIQMQEKMHTPIIYLTANSDEATFNRAKATKPYAFISKPFKQIDLQRAIELAIGRMTPTEPAETDTPPDALAQSVLTDRIFLRHKDRMVKVLLSDILHLEADRNYTRIYTKQGQYMLSVTLKTIEAKLPQQLFMRIHRSFIINVAQVDEFAENHVLIGQATVPLGGGMRDLLLQRMQTL